LTAYLGLDGFRGGWVAAWIKDDGSQHFDCSPTLSRLLSIPHRRAMIDIPIGLPGVGYRSCDIQAREYVGPTVFPGARRGLWIFASQDEANQHYWKHEGKGMGISCQLWNIREKIKEVDDIITPERQDTLCETHPELIFWNYNGRHQLESKRTEKGRQERIAILKKLGFFSIEKWLGLRFGTGIGRDDLIDACACAIAARDAKSTIGDYELDCRKLRMQMHF
jgi:predicted RNase H-like nuclease